MLHVFANELLEIFWIEKKKIMHIWKTYVRNLDIEIVSFFLVNEKMTLWTDNTVPFMQPPKFEFNDPKTPFYTSPRFLPPTKVEKCRVWSWA